MAPHVAMVTCRRLATNSCSHALIFFPFFSLLSTKLSVFLVSSPLFSARHLFVIIFPSPSLFSHLPPVYIHPLAHRLVA